MARASRQTMVAAIFDQLSTPSDFFLGLLETQAAFEALGLPEWLVRFAAAATMVFVAFAAAAIYLASRPRRAQAHFNKVEILTSLLQLVGEVMLTPVYALSAGERPLLGWQRTPQNEEILAQCPTLLSFKQTPWLRNSYLSFVALSVVDGYGAEYKNKVRRELLEMPDGGMIALDWWEDQKAVAPTKGVLFIGSSCNGDSLGFVTRGICAHFTGRGWRCVTMVKRGCGLFMPNTQPMAGGDPPLEPAPAPWCFSGFGDIKQAIDHVARTFPNQPICGIGISVGGGQLRNYVNRTGKDSKLAAMVCLDAAPCWLAAIKSTDERVPLVANSLYRAGRQTLANCGRGSVAAASASEGHAAAGDGTLPKGAYALARDYLGPGAGYEASRAGAEQYLNSCTPADSAGCKVPTLELVSLNDTLMTPEMAHTVQSFYKASPHVVTALTREGTHVIRWEGWWPRCWIGRAAAEFLEASLSAH